tara:strand:- start:1783 stop:3045 length:1263 start_codon:yes stop_codon:yes gene_type:complete
MFNVSFNFFKKIKRYLFPFYRNKELIFVFKKLHEGFSKDKVVAKFVGGCVRKHLAGDTVDDIDIATTLSCEEIKERFKETKFKIIETGIEHGTITIVYKKLKIEITTLRKDIKTDGRHAEVEYIDNWVLDSERRDFTINAIYLDINGKIFDPQMGMTDLKNNNVKFIGDPQKRIEEDYLRIIRFLRFAIQYDSNTDDNTIKALKLNLNGIQKISKERILGELIKILELKNFENILKHHNKKLIFSLIFPELKFLNRLQKLKSIYKYSSINRDILLATLLIDEKENYEYFCHKYKVSNEIKDKLKLISKNLKLLRENKNFFDSDLEKNIYLNGKNHLISINILNYTINDKYKLSSFSKNLKKILKSKVHKFPIDGDYLIAKGMSEGLALGKVLKKVENEWINNNFKVSEEKIQSIIKQNSN